MDHLPIEGARITVDETGNVRYTNADGRYQLALPCRADPFLVRVIADGYPEISDMIDSPGGHITRNFVVGGDESGAPEPRPGSREAGGARPLVTTMSRSLSTSRSPSPSAPSAATPRRAVTPRPAAPRRVGADPSARRRPSAPAPTA